MDCFVNTVEVIFKKIINRISILTVKVTQTLESSTYVAENSFIQTVWLQNTAIQENQMYLSSPTHLQ